MWPLFLQSEGHSRFKVIFSKIKNHVMLSTNWQGKMWSKILNLLLFWARNDLNLVLHSIWVQVRYHPYTWEATQVIISVALLHISFISGLRKLHNKVAITHALSHTTSFSLFLLKLVLLLLLPTCTNGYHFYFGSTNFMIEFCIKNRDNS